MNNPTFLLKNSTLVFVLVVKVYLKQMKKKWRRILISQNFLMEQFSRVKLVFDIFIYRT
jgi:hypothetical protein